jgi:hypothetical protein
VDPQWLSAWGIIGSGAATVGTLLLAIAVLRVEQKERRRDEVHRVRCYLNAEEPAWLQDERASNPDFDFEEWLAQDTHRQRTLVAVVVVDNASDEVIYNVKTRIAAVKVIGGAEYMNTIDIIKPGEDEKSPPGPELPVRSWSVSDSQLFGKAGVEMLFTDGRGRRWLRDDRGRLRERPAPAWYTPWRVPHKLDRSKSETGLFWYQIWSHWNSRHSTARNRVSNRRSPQWWFITGHWHYRHDVLDNRIYDEVAPRPPQWWFFIARLSYWREKRRDVDDLSAVVRADDDPGRRNDSGSGG